MSNYAEIVAADQRLAILQALQEDPDYSHNEHVLGRLLGVIGHQISGDRLRSHLAWLAEQDLVGLADVGGVQVAKLSRRGEDVALGHAREPGVARPRPGG